MLDAIKVTNSCGQNFTVHITDAQLYQLVIENMWVSPQEFPNLHPHMGIMHWEMNFIGCIGTLHADSGLSDILKSAFGSVDKMLIGKKYPQNERALRMVVEELLRPYISKIENVEEFDSFLKKVSQESKTSKHWVENLIRPVLLLMKLKRAERESDWPLSLKTCRETLPYMFASGHHNYSRLGVYHIMQMSNLPEDVQDHFLKGEHTVRFKPGYANGISGDNAAESSYMLNGKSVHGIVGNTTNETVRSEWALSLHARLLLINDVRKICNDEEGRSPSTHHKEETKGRLKSDAEDRNKIRIKLNSCIDPLNPDGHPLELINIVSGKIADSKVNVENAVEIGKNIQSEFVKSLPEGYHKPINRQVVTMSTKRKSIAVNAKKTQDESVIFSRALRLMITGAIDPSEIFDHELTSYPPALFKKYGTEMRSTPKHTLKKELGVNVSVRNLPVPKVQIIDGCAHLYHIVWPNSGTVKDIITSIKIYIEKMLEHSEVWLLYDRYREYSLKGGTRCTRRQEDSTYHLSLESSLPGKKVMLSVTDNKVQLIELICLELPTEIAKSQISSGTPHSFFLVGSDPRPVQVQMGVVIRRSDISIDHEEADTMMPNIAFSILQQGISPVHVKVDDTDVFVLLAHFYHLLRIDGSLMMIPFASTAQVTDIRETVLKHSSIIPYLLSLHSLTGCDTVPSFKGIGKPKALKVLKEGILPPELGLGNPSYDEATKFIAKCYHVREEVANMSAARYPVWRSKTKSKIKSIKLEDLPPTTKCFIQNVKRAEIQAAIWRSSLKNEMIQLDPTEYGWRRDEENETLVPLFSAEDISQLPSKLEKLMACNCASDTPCRKGQCGCRQTDRPCSIFCRCFNNNCCNPFSTVNPDENEGTSENEEEKESDQSDVE